MLQFGQLHVEITESQKEVEYRFRGDVDENFRQKEFPRIKKERIIFHLEDVKNFNSIGLREWIFLLRDVSALGHLVFRRCSVTIVDQINMVDGFLPSNAKVQSFYVPYYNEESGAEKNILFTVFNPANFSISKLLRK